MHRILKTSDIKKDNPTSLEAFADNVFATNPKDDLNSILINKQLEILNDAIERYNRLEEIKKYTALALDDIENVTEEDIERAAELEEKISIEDDLAVQKLLESEGLIKDIFGGEYETNGDI